MFACMQLLFESMRSVVPLLVAKANAIAAQESSPSTSPRDRDDAEASVKYAAGSPKSSLRMIA